MDVTVYETQTLDGVYSLSLHMTLKATISQMVQQTVIATEGDSLATSSTVSSATPVMATTILSSVIPSVSTSVEPSSFGTSSSSSQSSQSTPEATPPSAAQMSTGSIVGIAVGSIAALVLLVTFLLFAFGFRIRQARRRGGTVITEHKKHQRAAAVAPASQNGKAELEDAGYTRRLERLYDGARPELEGSNPRKTGWRAFSITSWRRGPRAGPAELDAETVTQEPHELPA